MIGKKVLVALSGGVDSSMSACILKDQGYDLIGVTLRVFKSDKFRQDSLNQGIKDAALLANKLKIPYFVIDVTKEFEQVVINNFTSEYYMGRTPNPCALCNSKIKWKYLLKTANEFNCEFVATGHYSQVEQLNERFYISKAIDETKDQSFFLWRLNQEELKRCLFPLGKINKQKVKSIAESKGFANLAKKRESYNICFIPDGDYRNYLKIRAKNSYMPHGNFVDISGEIIGKHDGIVNYTIGQRSGIYNINKKELFVLKIISDKNKIILGEKKLLGQSELTLIKQNFTKYDSFPINSIIHAKVNYKSEEVVCKLSIVNNQFNVHFDNSVSISPGQSIAFYEGKDLIGGGIIA